MFQVRSSGGISIVVRADVDGNLFGYTEICHSAEQSTMENTMTTELFYDGYSQLPARCDFTSLQYEIASNWPFPDGKNFAFLQDCEQLSGTVDPTYACGPRSEYVNTAKCPYRPNQNGYTCQPNTFDISPVLCEIGDISGKYGNLKCRACSPNCIPGGECPGCDHQCFYNSSFTDSLSIPFDHYISDDAVGGLGSPPLFKSNVRSIVYRCPNGEPVACARLIGQ
eukprot:GHVH01006686.1.p1 GENE.GHVH01006686.1~~GHVH01006686.1.p1  ORF type:complete len:224 (+),score=19.13 GHVH01006686.1:464-1135(+)